RRVPYRHDRKHRRERPGRLLDPLSRAVVVQVEGNPAGAGRGHELVLVAAQRIATAECFLSVLVPRRALHPRFAEHTGLAGDVLGAGEEVDVARGRWASFLRADDVLVGWGTFSPRLLATAGMVHEPWLDLRPVVIGRLGRRPGGVEAAARALGDEGFDGETPGRAGRRLHALSALVGAILTRENRAPDLPIP
ncbi:MAG: hypothetical protein ACREQL_04205, partial [Candidatus Binatia bacterium]